METYRDIAIYDLSNHYLLIGRPKSAAFYKLLKIKKAPSLLEIQEVKKNFKKSEIGVYLKDMLRDENKQPIIKAEVLLGAVKFLQGYYLYIVTKKTKVGILRGKSLYRVDSAKLFKLFTDKKTKDEKKYVDIFNSLDIQLGFYFSYSYDLTHTLQENILNTLMTLQPERSRNRARTFHSVTDHEPIMAFEQKELYDWKTMFVWNHDMIEGLYSILTDKNWLVPIMHGFIGYRNLTILGRKYDLVVISRRSRHFAGTRYLKRGLSEEGKVANDVETEQILIEKIPNGKITAFVQHRGSVPLFWCQDPNSMLPSPPIILNQNDFLHYGTIRHFSDMLQRYGAPIVIINLLRNNDKNKEFYLSREYKDTVENLNDQIPEEYKLEYTSFDIKNEIKKSKKTYEESFYNQYKDVIKKTSIFTAFCKKDKFETNLQIGVIRTNCVDCIDRTNEGQLLISHLALEMQLKELGVCESLSKKSEIVQTLTKLFEEMGDAIALQYSGSIAHKATNSKEKSKQSKLIVATQRHLANLIKDSKKQQAINLYLGIFKPDLYPIPLWEISDDFRLHNKLQFTNWSGGKWWKFEINKFCQRLGIRKEKNVSKNFLKGSGNAHKVMNRVKVFNYDKNLLVSDCSNTIRSLDKKYPGMLADTIEISIQEAVKEELVKEEHNKNEVQKKNAYFGGLDLYEEETEFFESYVKLAEVGAPDNFHLAIVNEELHCDVKEVDCSEFEEYLNLQGDGRKLLREFDDEDEGDSKSMKAEIVDIIIIDSYLDECRPPLFFKCVHYKELHPNL